MEAEKVHVKLNRLGFVKDSQNGMVLMNGIYVERSSS